MKRTELERLKAELSTRYAERLEHEQTHLSENDRAHMCIGFEHGMGWLFKILETAGFEVDEEAEPPEPWLCRACRLVSPADAWRRAGEPASCPRCGSARETMRPPSSPAHPALVAMDAAPYDDEPVSERHG